MEQNLQETISGLGSRSSLLVIYFDHVKIGHKLRETRIENEVISAKKRVPRTERYSVVNIYDILKRKRMIYGD